VTGHPRGAAGPVLRALTPEAEAALGGRREVVIDRFPYRVGRDSRNPVAPAKFAGEERRSRPAAPINELFLRDDGERKTISREHFQVERGADGRFEIVERGSACGTIVGNRVLGGRRSEGRSPLADGNVIIAGSLDSPFVFQFLAGGAPRNRR